MSGEEWHMFAFQLWFFLFCLVYYVVLPFSSFEEKRKEFSCLGRQRTWHEIFRKIDIDREREGWISMHSYSYIYILYTHTQTHTKKILCWDGPEKMFVKPNSLLTVTNRQGTGRQMPTLLPQGYPLLYCNKGIILFCWKIHPTITYNFNQHKQFGNHSHRCFLMSKASRESGKILSAKIFKKFLLYMNKQTKSAKFCLHATVLINYTGILPGFNEVWH